MADLFSNMEPPKPKKRIYYKGRDGKFSDKETARFAQIEKDRDRYKLSSEYYKRQAERLAENYRQEHEKVLALEEKLKRLSIYDSTADNKSEKVAAS